MPDAIAAGTALGLAEMIASGTTCIADMYMRTGDHRQNCAGGGHLRLQHSFGDGVGGYIHIRDTGSATAQPAPNGARSIGASSGRKL